jgi:predicted ArsR family transcriptional regulator
MARDDWRDRFLGSTRGRIVSMLRRTPQTVNDLAQALGLTDNAVRLHLSALERDGLVQQRGTRRDWTGKPAYLYQTTSASERLFPKAFDVVLAELLTVLANHAAPEDIDRLLEEVGSRLGRAAALPSADLRERVQHAASVLNDLGGLAEVEELPDGYLLRGYSCPLDDLTAEHPRTCLLAEAMVRELVGRPAFECCDRSERPRCAFQIK